MKKLITVSLAIILTMAFCFNLGLSIPKARAEDVDNSRDVIPPTTYITEDQAHSRLFSYNGTTFTNISTASQNISPEVNALAWNESYWAMAARGRLWRYDGTTVTEVLTPDPGPTPQDNIYPYAAIGSNGAGGEWLAGTLTGRCMYYNGTDTPSAYFLANSQLTANVDDNPATTTLPVLAGARFKAGDVVQVGMEFCLVESVLGNDLTVQRGYNSTPIEMHWTDQVVSVVCADTVSIDWDGVNSRWLVGGLTPDFSTHLFATSANNTSTDLGLTGVGSLKGDYRVGDYSYYLVGGQTPDGTASKLYSYDNNITFADITNQIPNMNQSVTVITGGGSNWLVGGEGTNILYSISEAGGTFTGTPITTPTELTSVTAIGYASGNNWLIGGKNSVGMAQLYNYNGSTFTDLTAEMQGDTQAAISTINTIVWNNSYWLIGGAGLFNVGPDNGGSVMSTDEFTFCSNSIFCCLKIILVIL
jgi:hypothetical protein